ncbi:hypothetical protein B0H10DRAFT_1399612 [Mycena sp. CBHHK59/15]|nr:hypothetical protein B0H10DRAFT_1399612 [Mycena sp. CBHHK59/15]
MACSTAPTRAIARSLSYLSLPFPSSSLVMCRVGLEAQTPPHKASLGYSTLIESGTQLVIIYKRGTADPRFVMLMCADYLDGCGARGGEGYWVVAVALVKKRRSGETKK